MHILNKVQVNFIYNTNRTLFLWIEIFISTTDLYNTTADRRSCHLPNRNKQLTCFQWGSVHLRSDIKGTEQPPTNILKPLEMQLIALQLCHWQFLYSETLQRIFVLYCRNCPKDDNIGIWSHFEERRRTLVDGSLDSPCPLFTARIALQALY